MTSSAKKNVCSRPSGSSTSSCTACSYGLPAIDLDHATREVEARVVVRPHLAERRQLRQHGERLAHPRERVVAGAEVVEVVADPAARVREQVPHRHARGDVLVAQLQLGEIRAHGRIEVELAALDEPHRGGAGERLRDRADLEERVGRDVERVLGRRDAEAGDVLLALVQQPDGDARRLRLLHRRAHRVADPIEDLRHERSTLTHNPPMSLDFIVLDDAEAAARRVGELLAEAAHDGGHIALSGGKSPELAHETAARLQPGLEPRRALVGRRALRAAGRRALELRDGEAHAARPRRSAAGRRAPDRRRARPRGRRRRSTTRRCAACGCA